MGHGSFWKVHALFPQRKTLFSKCFASFSNGLCNCHERARMFPQQCAACNELPTQICGHCALPHPYDPHHYIPPDLRTPHTCRTPFGTPAVGVPSPLAAAHSARFCFSDASLVNKWISDETLRRAVNATFGGSQPPVWTVRRLPKGTESHLDTWLLCFPCKSIRPLPHQLWMFTC